MAGKSPKKENSGEFDQVAAAATSESSNPKAAEIAKRNAEAVRKAAKSVSVDSVVKDIGALGLDVNRTLDGIKEKISVKVGELAQLQQAIELEKARLTELHSADVVASATSELVAQHEAAKAQMEAEIKDIQAKAAEEKALLEKYYKELNEESKKTRAREQQDYEYTTSQARRRANDEFEDMMRTKAREAANKQEALEKSWASREESLAAKETEFATLKAEVTQFPEVLKKEVDKSVAIATSALKRNLEVEAQLAAKDYQSEMRTAAQEIVAQNKLIAQLESTITDLRNQLTDKSSQVQEIAVKAVESAAGRQALDALRDVQTAQATGSSGSKK